ncbi:sigma-54 dependent transcriptional regulator [Candidatus Methylomirabilis sp.]|uniref:sigma-54-dependent transcriptional regulator n=1 Tax=Candidatus Methylomirabilis sp. TaxID=2032687 RepID=UPI003076387F
MREGRILVVDDDGPQREILRTILSTEGYSVDTAPGGAEAVRRCQEKPYDLVLTDLRMPGTDGLALMERLPRDNPSTLVILMTAYGSLNSAEQAMRRGAFDYLTKPLEREELLLTVRRAFERIQLGRENKLLRQQLEERFRIEGIVGSHFRMQEVFEKIGKVSKSSSTVLLIGESGTGKELIARTIHRQSQRQDHPFIAVNCAAIPESLLESEIFGHERGAFTGAVERRAGCFELAHGGTLFLDEVVEMQLPTQAKFLRVLQGETFRRLGGKQEIDVDVRIVAATNRDPAEAVKDGLLREDLFYRLNVVSIVIPPLRERSTDIPQLVEYFIKKHGESVGKLIQGISNEAMRLLMNYHWPGNVRQLEAVVERASLLSEGPEITHYDLPIEVRFFDLPAQPSPSRVPGSKFAIEIPEQGINFEALERDLILQAMEKSDWVITKAARLLGMSYRTLQYRLEKFQIRRDTKTAPATSESGLVEHASEQKGGM